MFRSSILRSSFLFSASWSGFSLNHRWRSSASTTEPSLTMSVPTSSAPFQQLSAPAIQINLVPSIHKPVRQNSRPVKTDTAHRRQLPSSNWRSALHRSLSQSTSSPASSNRPKEIVIPTNVHLGLQSALVPRTKGKNMDKAKPWWSLETLRPAPKTQVNIQNASQFTTNNEGTVSPE